MFGSHTALPSASSPELRVLCVSAFSSPNLDALDAASTISPLSAALTKNTAGGGGGVRPERLGVFRSLSLPFDFKLSSACPEPRRRVSLLSPISFRLRTSPKRARNPFRIRTSKTKDLKSFRIRSYEKTPGGRGPLFSFTSSTSFTSFTSVHARYYPSLSVHP